MTNKAFAAYNIHSDIAANRPATPTIADGQLYVFQATDTHVISIWDGTVWQEFTARNYYYDASAPTPAGVAGTVKLMQGLGVSPGWAITPKTTGRIGILATGIINNDLIGGGGVTKLELRYGTGSAPTNGAAATGTSAAPELSLTDPIASAAVLYLIYAEVSGLTVATQYWFDFSVRSGGAGGNATILPATLLLEEKRG